MVLQQNFAAGILDREDVFLTAKLKLTDMDPSNIENCLDITLDRLQTKYLDCFLMHDFQPQKIQTNDALYAYDHQGNMLHDDSKIFIEAWKVIEDIYKRTDKLRAIGLFNFNPHQLRRIKENCMIVPAINQFKLNPYCNRQRLIQRCVEYGIKPFAYSCIGSGLLEDYKIAGIANKHSVVSTNVLLQWVIDQGIGCVLGSDTPYRIQSNLYFINKFHLTDEERDVMNSMDLHKAGKEYRKCCALLSGLPLHRNPEAFQARM